MILFNLLLQMSMPPLFSENKRASETLGQLEFRSLQGLTSPLMHKFVEGRLNGKVSVFVRVLFSEAISQANLWSFSSISSLPQTLMVRKSGQRGNPDESSTQQKRLAERRVNCTSTRRFVLVSEKHPTFTDSKRP